MRSSLLSAALLVWLLAIAVAPVARAEAPFGVQRAVAQEAGFPALAMTPRGDAVLVFSGSPGRRAGDPPTGAEGVYAADRAAGGLAFGAPVRLDAAQTYSPQVSVNARGDAAVAYTPSLPRDPSTCAIPQDLRSDVVRVVLRPAGGRFGPPEDVPGPPPVGSDDRVRRAVEPQVALGPDGTLVVAWVEIDTAARSERAVAVVRAPGGEFGPAQVLDASAASSVRLAADAGGRVLATWSSRSAGGVAVADRLPGQAFGAAQLVPGSDGGARPAAVLTERSEAVVAWGGWGVGAAVRSAGAAGFEPAQKLGDGNLPTVAANAAGDVALSWSGPALFGVLRRAGGDLGSPASTGYEGTVIANPVALDAQGTTIVLGETRRGLVAHLRRHDAPFSAPVAVSAPGGGAGSAAIVTDAFGNGVAAWSTYGDEPQVEAAIYSATVPRVEDLRATRPARFRYRLSEAATVRLVVRRRGRRVAVLRARGRRGVNRLRARGRARRRLARPGRYVAALQARDGGPRSAAAIRVRYRVGERRR